MEHDAERIIGILGLSPLPEEGGWYGETWRSEDVVGAGSLPARYAGGQRHAGSAILYLLAAGSRSAIHRLATDEVWHFYLGDPVEMLLLGPGGRSRVAVLGHGLSAGQEVQVVAPRGWWMGARIAGSGRMALLGTTMAPAFDPRDREMGRREDLVRDYPDHRRLIESLT